jgi:hypothetical protein
MKFTCPVCREPHANALPNSNNFHCNGKCNKTIGNIFDFVRVLEPDKSKSSEKDIKKYLYELFGIPIESEKDIKFFLDFYQQQGFDLVPISPNSKVPIEKEWPTKNHKDSREWERWLDEGLNIGVKTGAISNITVIDFDTKEIPANIKALLKDYTGLVQETRKGFHYFFKYEPELAKTHIDEYKIDVENDGGQVVLFPSVTDDSKRKFLEMKDVPVMPAPLRDFLKKYAKVYKKEEEPVKVDLAAIGTITAGNRNQFLFSFGSTIRREMNIQQTGYVLNLVNQFCCKPSLPFRELETIVRSVEKYKSNDQSELTTKIFNYLKMVGDATSRDIKEVIGEKKELIDKALAYLVKEGFIIKHRAGSTLLYSATKKADWKEEFPAMDCTVPFKVPYFYDAAMFNWGDLILLGSKSKFGKTTISMNMVKSFVDQGFKPYYISLETGSRFFKTARQLGIKEGDFVWDFQPDPTKVELEKNAITIIDWLMIEDKAQTDSILKYFVEQLFKTNGFLIIFMQLKADGTWFAPNMVDQFPALGARYLYKDAGDGTEGTWIVDPIREPIRKGKRVHIDCVYDWDKRILQRLDEVVGVKNVPTNVK